MISVSVRSNMRFFVVFVALIQAWGHRVGGNSFRSWVRHDDGKRGCKIGAKYSLYPGLDLKRPQVGLNAIRQRSSGGHQ